MVMHVGDEEDGRRSLLLRGKRLSPRHGRLRGHHAVKRAVRIVFARLVIERQHDLALQVACVVVVLQVRRADAEADKHGVARGAAARAEPMRIELLPAAQASRSSVPDDDFERVAVAERRGHEVVGLEVRITRPSRGEARTFEARADVIRCGAVLVGVGKPSAHRVAGEKKQVGAQLFLKNRIVLWRTGLRHQDG